jgi:hypothetical protein
MPISSTAFAVAPHKEKDMNVQYFLSVLELSTNSIRDVEYVVKLALDENKN